MGFRPFPPRAGEALLFICYRLTLGDPNATVLPAGFRPRSAGEVSGRRAACPTSAERQPAFRPLADGGCRVLHRALVELDEGRPQALVIERVSAHASHAVVNEVCDQTPESAENGR